MASEAIDTKISKIHMTIIHKQQFTGHIIQDGLKIRDDNEVFRGFTNIRHLKRKTDSFKSTGISQSDFLTIDANLVLTRSPMW
jgi:hypothetical protein